MRSSEEDYGQFNDSVVMLNPIRFTTHINNKLGLHNPTQKTHLGIYQDHKLSSFIKSKQGKVISLVTLDTNSMNTFVNQQGISILEQYPTNQIAFIFVIGNKKSGKSFFCDKILNLSEIKGNQFCRNNTIGIQMWSTPFQKDTLKVFLLQINGCQINSQEFKILSTYAIIVGSVFFVLDDVDQKQQSGIEQFDSILSELSTKLSRMRSPESRQQLQINQLKYMPEFIYYLKRTDVKKSFNLQTIKYFIDQKLPDAKVSTYKGTKQELIHLSFLDNKAIDQQYMQCVSKIFKEMLQVISQKKLNELIINGDIIIKILKYVQNYLNSNQTININVLYDRLIEELYQSAYNYCILTYHEQMEKALDNQEPKSIEELLDIFQVNSQNILDKFQEFNLDPQIHHIYYQKLQKHIDEKEILIMEVNKLKTQRVIMEAYNPTALNNQQTYKSLLKYIKQELGHLTHGKAEALAKFNYQFYKRMQNIDYKVLKEIEKLNNEIEHEHHQLKALQENNKVKSKERNAVQQLLKVQQGLDNKRKQLLKSIQSEKHHNNESIDDLKTEIPRLQETTKKNSALIYQLQNKEGQQKKKEILTIESKIEETKRNCSKLESLINEIKSTRNVQSKIQGKIQGKNESLPDIKQSKKQSPKKPVPKSKPK